MSSGSVTVINEAVGGKGTWKVCEEPSRTPAGLKTSIWKSWAVPAEYGYHHRSKDLRFPDMEAESRKILPSQSVNPGLMPYPLSAVPSSKIKHITCPPWLHCGGSQVRFTVSWLCVSAKSCGTIPTPHTWMLSMNQSKICEVFAPLARNRISTPFPAAPEISRCMEVQFTDPLLTISASGCQVLSQYASTSIFSVPFASRSFSL